MPTLAEEEGMKLFRWTKQILYPHHPNVILVRAKSREDALRDIQTTFNMYADRDATLEEVTDRVGVLCARPTSEAELSVLRKLEEQPKMYLWSRRAIREELNSVDYLIVRAKGLSAANKVIDSFFGLVNYHELGHVNVVSDGDDTVIAKYSYRGTYYSSTDAGGD